jgi:SAM-dependent methyltransferase
MPSSDYNSIPKVLKIVEHLHPRSILDVGVGNGRYGFLFREILDWNYARFAKESWQIEIDGVEIDPEYLKNYHRSIYNEILLGDFLSANLNQGYDLIFLGDVLEHWKDGEWQKALKKARLHSMFTLVVAPNHNGSLLQGAWRGHEYEKHHVSLSPEIVGGRCLYANSKLFISGFDNDNTGILDSCDICL